MKNIVVLGQDKVFHVFHYKGGYDHEHGKMKQNFLFFVVQYDDMRNFLHCIKVVGRKFSIYQQC